MLDTNKKEFHSHDKALINWAIQHKDENNDLSISILSNVIINISNIDEQNKFFSEVINISSIYRRDYKVGVILIDFLSSFRYCLLKGEGQGIEETNDIFKLPIATKGVQRVYSGKKNYIEPSYYFISNKNISIFYKDLIQTYLQLIETFYKKDFTKKLKYEFFDDDDDDDDDDFQLDIPERIAKISELMEPLSMRINVSGRISEIMDNLTEDMKLIVIKQLGIPDYDEFNKSLSRKQHPKLHAIKDFFMEIAPFLIFVSMCGILILIYYILAYLVDLL